MPEDQFLYNANDGLTGRDGGPYLDVEEDRRAEVVRARIEKREPDLDNPPASAGTVLITARQALENAGVNNLPSQGEGDADNSAEAALRGISEDEGNLLQPRAIRPAEGVQTPEDEVDLSVQSALKTDGTSEPSPGADETTAINTDEGTPDDGTFPHDV